jgi:hypothetical protein
MTFIPLYPLYLSMISAQTLSADVARENRYPLFRIMLQPGAAQAAFGAAGLSGLSCRFDQEM